MQLHQADPPGFGQQRAAFASSLEEHLQTSRPSHGCNRSSRTPQMRRVRRSGAKCAVTGRRRPALNFLTMTQRFRWKQVLTMKYLPAFSQSFRFPTSSTLLSRQPAADRGSAKRCFEWKCMYFMCSNPITAAKRSHRTSRQSCMYKRTFGAPPDTPYTQTHLYMSECIYKYV